MPTLIRRETLRKSDAGGAHEAHLPRARQARMPGEAKLAGYVEPLSRRQLLLAGGAAVAMALSRFSAPARAGPDSWRDSAEARAAIGDATPIRDGLVLDLPEVAENGESVPIRVFAAPTEDDFPQSVHVIAPANPFPRVAAFRLTPLVGRPEIATRIRLDQSQTVVVVAHMRSGAVRVAERAVRVATGGCIIPGENDWSEAMQTRVRVPQFERGVPGEVVALIKHPMENGLGPDAEPERIIERFVARLGGQVAVDARLGHSVAANPYLRFYLTPPHEGTLEIEWREDTGERARERVSLAMG